MSELEKKNTSLRKDTKVIILVLLLLLAFPVGVIMLWVWSDTFPKWLNILLTSLILIPIILILVSIFGYVLISLSITR